MGRVLARLHGVAVSSPDLIVAGNYYDKYNSPNPIARALLRGFLTTIKDLYLVDGSAGVVIGYAMQANRIEPYE